MDQHWISAMDSSSILSRPKSVAISVTFPAMKIYTKTGDAGDTGLFGGGRVPKNHPRVEAYGDVDELNAVIGLARSIDSMPRVDEVLAPIQRDLFSLGALLATPDREKMRQHLDKARIGGRHRALGDARPPLRGDHGLAGGPAVRTARRRVTRRRADAVHAGRRIPQDARHLGAAHRPDARRGPEPRQLRGGRGRWRG